MEEHSGTSPSGLWFDFETPANESGSAESSTYTSLARSTPSDDGHDVTDAIDVFKPWDNPYNIINYFTFQRMQNIVECGVQPALFFVGFPANLLSVIVFCRQGLRDRMNCCLFSLALVDLLFVTIIFLCRGPYCFTDSANQELRETLKWYIRKHLLNFLFGFMYSSGCVTAIISVERCVCVIFPMKAATLIKTKTVMFLIVSVVLLIQVLCSVYGLMHKVISARDAETGRLKLVLGYSDFFEENKNLINIVDYFVLPTITFITFFVVSISTMITVINLKKAMAWRQQTSSGAADKRQMALVKMLVTVSCIYIACSAPMVALSLTRFLVADFWTTGRYRNIFYMCYQLGYAVLMINSSVNFFVYVAQSSRFKRELTSLYCCRVFGRDSKSEQDTASTEKTQSVSFN